jgi:hypothetical protein
MASIRLLPAAARSIGWQWVFLTLAPGPLLGAYMLTGLMKTSGVPRNVGV